MRDYVRLQTGILLRRFASNVNRTARTGDARDIHDLRVSIRRLNRCLRVFKQLYPGNTAKQIRRRLSRLMDACGNVRDCDIAVGLLAEAGVPPASPLLRQLVAERGAACLTLKQKLQRCKAVGLSRTWRARLEV
jgi:CHAD domain-containing protein